MADPFDVQPILDQLRNPVKVVARVLDFVFEIIRSDQLFRRNITVICVSDTHCLVPKKSIPFGDILIHAGDFANQGSVDEIQAQIDWLHSLPHRYKIAIAGNHDTYLDPKSRQTLSPADRSGKIDWKGIIYLEDSSVDLDFVHRLGTGGKTSIKVYGLPHIPACGGPEFAFQYPRGTDIWSGKVPVDTDILVTHTPPKYHLDLPAWSALGDEYLLSEVRRTKPLLHVFGHVHAGKSDLIGTLRKGQDIVRWDSSELHFARIMSRPSSRSFISGWTDLYGFILLWVAFVLHVVNVARDVLGWETPATRLVNAALMYRNTGQLGNEVQVIHI